MKEELEKEREERNYYQLEKDQVATYYEISKTQLDQKNAVIRNKERELEEATEKHQSELKVTLNAFSFIKFPVLFLFFFCRSLYSSFY